MAIIGVVLIVFAAVAFFASLDMASIGGFIFSLILLGAGFIIIATSNSNSPQKQEVVATSQATPSQPAPTQQQDSSSGQVSNQQSQQQVKYPSALPSDASDDVLKKWWQDWTDDLLKNQTSIGCKDGVQIVVFGDADTTEGHGYTKWAGGYVRIHPDGKPFTCDESKDPTKEVSL